MDEQTQHPALKPKQVQAIALYARDGKTVKQISLQLGVSNWVVRQYLHSARESLGAETLAQMVYLVTAKGLLKD